MTPANPLIAALELEADRCTSLAITPEWRQAIDDPSWSECGPVHDWRKYVPDSVVDAWDSLPLETRLIVYVLCAKQSQSELAWDD
jgi:hypothetical protein